MEDTFHRKPSCLESFFMDLDDCGCNMTFHYFLQLDRRPPVELLDRTLRSMLETHPGMNLKFERKAWHASDELPAVSVIEADTDDVYSLDPARLDFRRHTLALNVIHTGSDLWFLRFDFFHGAVDGRSGVQFIYDFFAALSGRAPCKNEFSLMDSDLISPEQAHGKKLPIPCWPDCHPRDWQPTGKGEDKTFVLRTMACTRSMAAKLASAVGKCFSEKAQMIIPVDVRRFAPTKKSLFGNLIVPIFVDANADRHIEDLRSEILGYVKERSLLSAGLNSLFFYNKIPGGLRVGVLRQLVPLVMKSRNFICCALVSPIGEVDGAKLENSTFAVEDVAVTFVSFPFTAFTVTSVQYDGHTNTTVAWNSGRVAQKVADDLIHSIDESIRT